MNGLKRMMLPGRKLALIIIGSLILIHLVAGQSPAFSQPEDACVDPANAIVAENCLPGTLASEWDVSGAPGGSAKHRNCYNNIDCDRSDIWTDLWRKAPGTTPANTLPAWQSQAMNGWLVHLQLVVHNNATTALPADYTVSYVLDTASLIAANQMLGTCDDLRVTFDDGTDELELHRLVEGCNTPTTSVWFRTQAFIPQGASDAHYHLYYDNLDADAAPANPNNVFAFHEDFQDGATGWQAVKGAWSVVGEGDNFFYRYTGEGANWALSYFPLAGVADLDYIGKVRAANNTNWIGLAFRIQDPNNFLTFYQSKDVNQFKFARVVSDNHFIPIYPGFTMPADTWHFIRLQAVGSQVRARIWPVGDPEPANWNIQYTETNFQAQTNIGATLYYHDTNADWDDIQVRKLVDSEPSVELYEPAPPITDWYYRAQVTVTNTSTTETLPAGYAVQFMLDTAGLIADGKMLSTCEDLRLGSLTEGEVFEIHRVVENCGSASTRVWFAIERPLAPAATDDGYYLYYGDPEPAPPFADEMQVFLFYEDWEKGTTHWTSAGGLDPANSGTMGTSLFTLDDWVSPTHSQIFPVKRSGGDAFSGFIPVDPNTTYAISAWAKSAANTYAPVGFDPYTADYVKGTEVWLWTNEWTINPAWSWRSAQFTTAANTAYIKIKSEWWTEAPGDQPVYMDNLAMRPTVASEPLLAIGDEETTLDVPVIAAIVDDGPVELGQAVTVSAAVSTTEGSITTVTLRIISPIALNLPMALSAGTNTDGTWTASYLPTQGGEFSYRIRATSSQNYFSLSPLHTFAVIDETPPDISGLTFTDPLFVKDTQTVSATVTDNGALSSVILIVAGATHPMTRNGDQYTYAWQVDNVGTIPFTITALDTAGNQAQLGSSFTSQPREVDVCTWKDCKVGAQSWSNDDGNTACKAELETAGLRGTYYYNGASTLNWFESYSADGHEVASHTVGHPCNPPSCFPNCTPESLMECPYTEADVIAYRQNQLEPNITAIEAGTNKPVLSLAWPCGTTDPGRMEAASYYYLGARGYYDWVAQLYWIEDVNLPVPDNLYNLNSAASYRQDFIDRAYTEGKWAIITSHGSCAGIDYMGTRMDVLWSAPVGEVLKYIYVRENTEFSGYVRDGQAISFTAAHTLSPLARQKLDGSFFPPIQFDNPVSLKVHIFETDTVLSVLVDNVEVPFTVQTLEGARYVVFDASLDVTRAVTVNLSDTTPPTVTGVAPLNGVIDVPLATVVQVTFSEAMDPATFTADAIRLRVVGAAGDVPATITVAEAAASLTPAAPLAPGRTYQVTVAGSVTDLAGNPLGVDDSWTFTAADQGSLTDTSLADFNSGSLGACYLDGSIGDGALRLPDALDEAFSGTSLPTGWTSHVWTSGSAVVEDGSLRVNGQVVRYETTYTGGVALEFAATFSAESSTHVGFGGAEPTYNDVPWIMFSTGSTGTALYTRVAAPGGPDSAIALGNQYLGAQHIYRIEWDANSIQFYVDGTLVDTRAVSINAPMRVAASDLNNNSTSLVIDWLRLGPPYLSPCVFESRVFDAQAVVGWLSAQWWGTTPVGTSVIVETRTGSSPVLESDWSDWQVVDALGNMGNPDGRYAQYRLTLTTTDGNVTPIVESVTLAYATSRGQFTGFVNLQGRPNDSGATIRIYSAADKNSLLLAEGASTASGAFTTSSLASNPLFVGETCYFQINRPLFLPTTVLVTLHPDADPVPDDWAHSAAMFLRPLTLLNTVVLLGGDATNSNSIHIGDAACIGGAFGSANPGICGDPDDPEPDPDSTPDVNGDGVVNILDLTLMGGNYGKNFSEWTP